MEFFTEIEIGEREAEMMARGFYAVARAEGGVHEREEALIGAFFADVGGSAGSLADLARQAPPTTEEVKLVLGGEAGALFLKTCLLLAYADGTYAPAERQIIAGYAAALGVSDADLGRFEESVREYLLSHLVHLQNTAATREVAKKLGL